MNERCAFLTKYLTCAVQRELKRVVVAGRTVVEWLCASGNQRCAVTGYIEVLSIDVAVDWGRTVLQPRRQEPHLPPFTRARVVEDTTSTPTHQYLTIETWLDITLLVKVRSARKTAKIVQELHDIYLSYP
nr:hypothetical protein CFP56_11502 [Quercus suber]